MAEEERKEAFSKSQEKDEDEDRIIDLLYHEHMQKKDEVSHETLDLPSSSRQELVKEQSLDGISTHERNPTLKYKKRKANTANVKKQTTKKLKKVVKEKASKKTNCATDKAKVTM